MIAAPPAMGSSGLRAAANLVNWTICKWQARRERSQEHAAIGSDRTAHPQLMMKATQALICSRGYDSGTPGPEAPPVPWAALGEEGRRGLGPWGGGRD